MCGISGIKGDKADPELLYKMLKRISHRGEAKYQNEKALEDNFSIGMNRLAIVDEELGKQPMSWNNQVYCIFNGEIYNHDTLRNELKPYHSFISQCDTEVILYAYIYWGLNFLRKLDGKFAICIMDRRSDKILLARDHIGIKPLYYSIYDNNVFFSSEVKSFYDIEYINEIKMLPPGSYLLNFTEKIYYTIPEYTPKNVANNQLMQEIKNRIISSVRKRIPENSKKIACLLSGGIDSSIITYLATQYHHFVEAFTFSSSENFSDDLNAAKLISKELGITHHIVSPPTETLKEFYIKYGVYLTESYEPVLVRNAVSYYFVCKEVRNQGYKWLLNGEGADELFGGYSFFKEVEKKDRDKLIRKSLLDIHKTYLHMADRASMFTTIEARVPFMDKDLIEYSMKLPSEHRIKGNIEKWCLRKMFENELPDFIIKRSKTGMNEGSGIGKNNPGESIYHDAVMEFYKANEAQYIKDLEVSKSFITRFTIDTNNIEEVYNFARYNEYNYTRVQGSEKRLQLNTKLINFANGE